MPFYHCDLGKKGLDGPEVITSFMNNCIPEQVSAGSDVISKGTVGSNISEFSSGGYRVYTSNPYTYGGGANSINTRQFYTFGRKYAKLYISKYAHQAGNGNSGGASITCYGHHANGKVGLSPISGTKASGQWMVFDVSGYDSVSLFMHSDGNDRYNTGTAGMGELIVQRLKMTNIQ
ncbi:MAG: hypothetical protein HDR21_15065 [Lachnospiraceae bacterium]|nr:hypothetical protein [Lachnospiraceae bacterium]MBD5482227.1 hypothetical protein [Lachnospiraceae bacterium]